MHKRNHEAIAAMLVTIPLLAWGLPEDRDAPIQLEADRAQFDQRSGVSVYEGNVVIVQGSMRLGADTVTIYMENDEFHRLEAAGNPATLRYRPEADKEELHGVGRKVDYDVTSATLVLTDEARVRQGKDEFTGDRIEYDLERDVVKARVRPGSESRVQVTIQPRSTEAR